MRKEEWVVFIWLVVIGLFLISAVNFAAAFQGTSESFSEDVNQDSYSGPGTSTSFTERIMGGIKAVSEYISASFTGRWGILGTNNHPTNPSPVLNSSDGKNQTGSILNCTSEISDINNDTLNVSVMWYKNNELNFTADYNNTYANGTLFGAELYPGNTTKHENWTCSMKLFDGGLFSNWTNSSQLEILNTAPNITLDTPGEDNITLDRTPALTWNSSDADNDTLKYDVNITCHPGCSDDDRYITGLEEANYTVINYLIYLADNDFYYNWSVRANDGEEDGNWSEMRRFDINALIDINMTTRDVDFGTLLNSESKNTTDDDPNPLAMRNDGNCFTNVSVNATEIFQDYSMPTPYYKIKVDNSTLEPDAFNPILTILDWINTPITTTFLIGEMNFSDSQDELEIEIYVEVPNDEGYGNKTSTLWFTGELGE